MTHPACSLNQLLCRYYIEPHRTITSLGRNGHMLATPQGSEQQRSWVTVSTTEAHLLVTPHHPTPPSSLCKLQSSFDAATQSTFSTQDKGQTGQGTKA